MYEDGAVRQHAQRFKESAFQCSGDDIGTWIRSLENADSSDGKPDPAPVLASTASVPARSLCDIASDISDRKVGEQDIKSRIVQDAGADSAIVAEGPLEQPATTVAVGSLEYQHNESPLLIHEVQGPSRLTADADKAGVPRSAAEQPTQVELAKQPRDASESVRAPPSAKPVQTAQEVAEPSRNLRPVVPDTAGEQGDDLPSSLPPRDSDNGFDRSDAPQKESKSPEPDTVAERVDEPPPTLPPRSPRLRSRSPRQTPRVRAVHHSTRHGVRTWQPKTFVQIFEWYANVDDRRNRAVIIRVCCDIVCYWDCDRVKIRCDLHTSASGPVMHFTAEFRCRRSKKWFNVHVYCETIPERNVTGRMKRVATGRLLSAADAGVRSNPEFFEEQRSSSTKPHAFQRRTYHDIEVVSEQERRIRRAQFLRR